MRIFHPLNLCCLAGWLCLAGCEAQPPAATPQSTAPLAEPTPTLGTPSADSTTSTESPSTTTPEESPSMLTVEKQPYGTTPDGQEITQFTMTNSHGLRVKLINLGAILTAVEVPDRAGKLENITGSFPSLDDYLVNAPYFGGICGRVANRIGDAKFTLEGKEYTLEANNGPNHLHGGTVGFMRRVWQAKELEGTQGAVGVELVYVSPDGEEGYPGALTSTVTYSLNDNDELTIAYSSTTDQPTVLNLTNHAYWNLAGPSSQSCLDHELTLFADEYLDITEAGIPTGKFVPVSGSCMDFTSPQKIGARIGETTNGNGGYDHCYVVRNGGKGEVVPVAKVVEPTSGRVMEISSTEPGVQLYTGNYLEGTPKTGGLLKQGAFCLETQHFPDSPNHPDFPTIVLRPGETYRQTTIHKFSVVK